MIGHHASSCTIAPIGIAYGDAPLHDRSLPFTLEFEDGSLFPSAVLPTPLSS